MPLLTDTRSRRVISALWGPRALNWRVGAWGLGATSALNLLSDPYVDFSATFTLGLIPFLASIPALVILIIAGYIAKPGRRNRAVAVMTTYVIVANLRPLFMALLVDCLAPEVTTNPVVRPLGSIVTVGVLVVVSFTINVVGSYQEGMSKAAVTRERLEGALDLARTELQRPVRRLDADVRAIINDIITNIRQALSTKADANELQKFADDITTSSTERIRQLSHDYSEQWSRVEIPNLDTRPQRHFGDLLRASITTHFYFPFTVSFLTACAMSYGVLPRTDNSSWALTLIFVWFAVAYGVLAVSKQVHRMLWRDSEKHIVVQGLLFVVATVIAGEAASFISGSLGGRYNVTFLTQYVTVPGLAVALAITLGLGAGLLDIAFDMLDEADKQNREIARVLVRVNAQRLRTQGSVSQFLHGKVQGQLIAASLLVRTHFEAGASVDDVRRRITDLLDEITVADLDAIEPPNVMAGLENLQLPWQDFVNFAYDIDAQTRSALDADPLGRFIFFDVVRESVNNALKHAKSQNIVVAASLDRDNEVTVTVTNDGLPWKETGSSGIGVRSLESITTSFEVSTKDGRTILRVSIPVAPVAS